MIPERRLIGISLEKVEDKQFSREKNGLFEEFRDLKNFRRDLIGKCNKKVMFESKKTVENYSQREFKIKKSCFKGKKDIITDEKPVILKKVSFSPDLPARFSNKITASSLISQIRLENKRLPELFSTKKLYYQLDDDFGFEGCNEYFAKYFFSPKYKLCSKNWNEKEAKTVHKQK